MKVLLDEHLPPALRGELTGHSAFSVQYMGWSSLKNGELMREAAAAGFDAMLTMDANIPYQHNPATLPLSVVIISAEVNDMEHLRPLVSEILVALTNVAPRAIAFVK